jgi:hypothetical protein
MRRLLGALIAAAVMAAACGGKSTPISPTEGTGAPVSPGSTGATATITGSVQGASASGLLGASSGAALTGVTVTVAGSAVSSSVDAGGRFTLTNVPPGDVQLQLTGGGANAAVALSAVRAAQTVDIVVMVAGASASIDSEVRSGAGESELEGRVESLPPTMPALSFKAAGRAVRTDGGTRFLDGSITRAFADLQIGMRVHVKGTLAGDTLTASQVELQNANIVPVEVNGIIDSVAGTAATFQFNIGSRVIKGDVLTAFFGDGDKPDAFASLKDGTRVEIKGQQRDGFIYATRIHVNGPDTTPTPTPDPGQDTSASIQGVLTAMSGARPALVLTVATTTVRTTSTTEVKRRGDVQTLDALKIGQTLHVVGDRQADGSIVARKIEIDDDAAGGEFEIEGAAGGLKGTCPAVQFGVNGFGVVTSASTTFEGGACSALKSGDKVTVKGTRQSDGSVAATRVSRK